MRTWIFSDTYHGTAATKSPLTRGVSGGLCFFSPLFYNPHPPPYPPPEGDKGGGTGIFESYMPGDPQK